jgi:hypothetical protein
LVALAYELPIYGAPRLDEVRQAQPDDRELFSSGQGDERLERLGKVREPPLERSP